MRIPKDKLEPFLEDLKQVFERHQIIIGACGCCDSPWAVDLEDDDDDFTVKGAIVHLRRYS